MKPKTCRHSNGIGRTLLTGFLLTAANSAQAQTSTWNLTTGNSWNTGGNWTGGIPDGSTAIATFAQNFTGTPIVTLDKADGFTVNQITYDDTGASGDSTLTISAGTGGKLILAGTTPTINTSSPLSINVALEGATGLRKSGSSTLSLSGTNTYTGVTSITAGTVNVSGDHSSADGGWTFQDTGGTVNFQAGSTIAVRAGANITMLNGGSAKALNVAGTVITGSNSQLNVRGASTLTLNSGASWTQNGPMTIQSQASGTSAVMSVNTGSSFTYANTANIVLARATSTGNGSATLNLSGGTFTTTRGFSNTAAGTGTGSTNLNFSNGGTLKISNNITSLIIQGTTAFNVATTNATGGIIDTNGFNTAIGVGITGAGSMTKAGGGTLTLSGPNTYAGGTSVLGGVLNTTQASALASYDTAGKVVINGGTLGVQVGGSGWTTGEVDTMLTNATRTSGALGIDTTNGSITQWTNFTTTNLGPSLGLEKLGTNSLTLDQTNTYSGATTVSAGTLYVTGTLSNSVVTVGAGGTIGSNGTAGTLGNGLTIQEGGNLDLTGATIGLDSTGVLSLTGGSLTLGNLTFEDLVGWDWLNAEEGTYELIDGNFAIDWGSTAHLSPETAYDFGNGKMGYFTSGSLNVVIVPEPRAALLGGLGLLVLLCRRRVA